MKLRGARVLLGLFLLALIGAACSGSSATEEGAETELAEGQSLSCAQASEQVIERFDTFVEPYQDLTVAEFLAQPELAELDLFQQDVGAIVQQVAGDPNDDCTERDLQDTVSSALQDYSSDSALAQSLIASVASGLQVEQRDVRVTPDDDLLAILPQLGPGSSVQFSEGEFELNATLLVQTELTLVGEGPDKTVLLSSAEAAAIAVLGNGDLTINDMAIEHTGSAPASVIIDFEAPLALQFVKISGAIADEDGSGGSGVVLSAAGEAPANPEVVITIGESQISNNESAGVASTSTLAPLIASTSIIDNAQCGICYFDESGGIARMNLLAGNGVGVQASGTSTVELSSNQFVGNTVAGLLIEDASGALVAGNSFQGEDIVGIDVQGQAAPQLIGNTFGPHAVALSLRGESTANVSNNIVNGGDVGLLIGGTASPSIVRNEVRNTAVSAMLHSEMSSATVNDNVITIGDGAGIVVEGSATPTHTANLLTGGIVGMVFRETSAGIVQTNTFNAQQVGVEAGDQSIPEIRGNTFDGQTEAGLIFSGSERPSALENSFTNLLAIGIQTSGSGAPLIERNEIDGGDTAALINESSQARYMDNIFSNQNFGIGVSNTAEPQILENRIVNATAGAMSFQDESSGLAAGNVIIDAGVVGIRVAGSASPDLNTNMIFALLGEGSIQAGGSEVAGDQPNDLDQLGASGAGILYADEAVGAAGLNQVFGFVIGIQVSDNAAPDLLQNRVEGSGVGGVGILYGDAGAGTAVANVSSNQQLGFQLGGTTTPEIRDNTVENAGVAAFLIQGNANPEVVENTCTNSAAGVVILEQAVPLLSDNACEILQQQ